MTIEKRNKEQAAIENALKLAFIKLQQTDGFRPFDGSKVPDVKAYVQILDAIRTYDPNFGFGRDPETVFVAKVSIGNPTVPRFFDRMDDATREATPQDYILFVKDRYVLTVRPEAYIKAVVMRKPQNPQPEKRFVFNDPHEQNNCNGSGPHTAGEVRVMPTGGGSNDILCRACWRRAIQDRRERNHTLGDFAKFPLLEWEQAKVYEV